MKTKSERDALNKILSNLVGDEALRAVCVQGEWGVGKTYSVCDFFQWEDHKKKLKLHGLKFAYVSLFGVDRIETVRERLCAAALENGKSFGANLNKVLPAIQVSASLGKLGTAALGGVTSMASSIISEAIQTRTLRKLVICIDDLERIGKSLAQEDVLGLIAELVERQECKCILLFNNSQLSADAVKNLAVAEEKLFDLRFVFAPTARENIHYASLADEDVPIVLKIFEAFSVSNVRVMRRAGWLIRRVRSVYPKDRLLNEQIVGHCAALCILKHSFAKELPDLKKAITPPALGRILFGSKEPSGTPPAVENAISELRFRGLPYTDSLIEILDTGRLDEEKLQEELKTAEAEFRNTDFDSKVDEVTASFNGSFSGTAAELAKKLFELLKIVPIGVPAKRGLQPLELLLRLDGSNRSEELARTWLSAFLRDVPKEQRKLVLKSFERLAALPFVEQVDFVDSTERPIPEDAFARLTYSDGSWSPDAYEDLANFSVNEIVAALRKMPRGPAVLRVSLDRLPIDGKPELCKILLEKFRAASVAIAKRDPIDQLRVDFQITPAIERAESILRERLEPTKNKHSGNSVSGEP